MQAADLELTAEWSLSSSFPMDQRLALAVKLRSESMEGYNPAYTRIVAGRERCGMRMEMEWEMELSQTAVAVTALTLALQVQ